MIPLFHEKLNSICCYDSFHRAGKCRNIVVRYFKGLSFSVVFILFFFIPSILPAEPVQSEGHRTYLKALSLTEHGQNAKALFLLNRLSDSLSMTGKGHSDIKLLMDVNRLRAENYQSLGDLDKALRLYRSAMKMAKSLSDDRSYARLCNDIFGIYYSSRRFSDAVDLLRRALKINISLNDSASIRNNYNNLGLVFYDRKKYREALCYMDSAFRYTSSGDRLGQSLIYTNRAEVFCKQGNYARAEAELSKASRLQTGLKFNPDILQTMLNTAYVKALLGKESDARRTVKLIHARLPETPLTVQTRSYRQLTDISFILGDSIEALHNILKYEETGDSVWRDNSDEQLRKLLVAYDSERLKNMNSSLEASVDIYRTIASRRTLMVCIVAVFLVILAVLIVLLLLRIRADRRKNRLINLQRDRLLLYEQREHERRQREMNHQLDSKNRQLTTYTIDLASISEFHRKLCDELTEVRDGMAKNKNLDHTKLNEIIHALHHYNDKPVSEDFRVYFDEVHPDFLNRLSQLYPNLSKIDLRLCAYLHIGMSTKEISALTCREVRSVESSRHRLRKKLGVPPGVSIHEFLADIAG